MSWVSYLCPFFPVGNSVHPKVMILPQKPLVTKKKSQYGSTEENSVSFDQNQFNQDEEFGTSEVQSNPFIIDVSEDEENDSNILGDITEPSRNRNVITVDYTDH